MTIDELIEEAARLGGWRLTSQGKIRRELDCCPLQAVGRATGFEGRDYNALCARLKVTIGDAGIIMRAADNDLRDEEHILFVRRRTLKAFGLADPTPARVDAGSVKEQQ